MRVEFQSRPAGPDRLVCDAEVVFDEDGPLAGMKLVGFALWRTGEEEIYVTFPCRSWGVGGDRRYYDFLRAVDASGETVKRVKDWIVRQWKARSAAA